MIEELLVSTAWEPQENESPEVFTIRKKLQMETWLSTVKKHGHCYMVKFGEDDVRPMWEDQINIEELVKLIIQPLYVALDCPLCQPYDYFDVGLSQYGERRHLTKIVHPKYPEGFIDKGGTWIKCVCLLKGESRKYLKFKGMRQDAIQRPHNP